MIKIYKHVLVEKKVSYMVHAFL